MFPGMVTRLIKALKREERKAAALESRIAKNLAKELSELHRAYGFESVPKFFKAIRDAHKGTAKKKVGRKVGREKRKRAKITAAIRATVKKLFTQGKSGSQIAKAAGISLPSVYNIKKALKKFRKPKKVQAKALRAPAKRKVVPKVREKHVTTTTMTAPEVKPSQAQNESVPSAPLD